MNSRVECPVCEARFEASGTPEQRLRCPECSREFLLSEASVVRPGPLATTPATTNQPAREIPVAKPVAASGNSPTVQQPQSEVSPVDFGRADRKVKISRSSGRSKSPLLVILLLAVVAAPLVVTLPYLLQGALDTPESDEELRRREIREAIASAENEFDAEDGAIDDATGDGNETVQNNAADSGPAMADTADNSPPDIDQPVADNNTGAVDPEVRELVRKVTQAPPDPEFRFLKQREFEDIWRRHQRRVLRLIVQTPLGEHHAVGTLIDSRGWVATSFRAIAGASRITVVQTASDFEKFSGDQLLVDEARGVIATDPDHDLAIISVNRRFVIDFSTIPLGEEDNLVGSRHVAQLGFVNTASQSELRSPLVGREAIIDSRKIFDDFSEQGRAILERAGLTDPRTDWVCNGTSDNASPGAPLIDPEGTFQGFNTDVVVDGLRLVCSSKHVADLKNISTDSPKPIATLSTDLENYGLGEYEAALSLRSGHPLGEVAVKLNRAAAECEGFNWLPTNNQQFHSVQRFLYFAGQLETIAASGESSGLDAQTADFIEKFDAMKERFTSRLLSGARLEPDSVKTVNRLTVDAIKEATRRARNRNAGQVESDPDTEAASQILFAYCEVFAGAMDSPKNSFDQETVAYRIEEHEEGVILPWNPEQPPALPGSRWLVVFSQPARGSAIRIRRADDATLSARFTRLIEIIGPTDALTE